MTVEQLVIAIAVRKNRIRIMQCEIEEFEILLEAKKKAEQAKK